MTIYDPNQSSAEQLEQHFAAMYASIDLINMLNEKTTLSEFETDTLRRNKEHLRIMLDKDFIKNDPRDKQVFIDAAN